MSILEVVDAGHGGHDPGAVDGRQNDPIYTEEEDLNLDCALKYGRAMERCGVIVRYTRTDDTYLTISARTAPARNLKANSLVSWHFNSTTDGSAARGIEVLYRSDSGLALAIYNQLVAVSPWGDRGLKYRSDLGILNGFAHSCIIEGGFVSNTAEEALLNDPTYRTRLAEAAARGACSRYGITYVPPTGAFDVPNAVYRFVRKDQNEHFYTASPTEAAAIHRTHTFEGVAWVADPTRNLIPIRRFRNVRTNQHMYTVSGSSEAASLSAPTWQDEGVAFYVSTTGTPIYRLRNTRTNDHLWCGATEYNAVAWKNGWIPEGIAWYVA